MLKLFSFLALCIVARSAESYVQSEEVAVSARSRYVAASPGAWCPTGYWQIDDEKDCFKAYKELYGKKASEEESTSSSVPQCAVHPTNNKVYFKTNYMDTASGGNWVRICVLSEWYNPPPRVCAEGGKWCHCTGMAHHGEKCQAGRLPWNDCKELPFSHIANDGPSEGKWYGKKEVYGRIKCEPNNFGNNMSGWHASDKRCWCDNEPCFVKGSEYWSPNPVAKPVPSSGPHECQRMCAKKLLCQYFVYNGWCNFHGWGARFQSNHHTKTHGYVTGPKRCPKYFLTAAELQEWNDDRMQMGPREELAETDMQSDESAVSDTSNKLKRANVMLKKALLELTEAN